MPESSPPPAALSEQALAALIEELSRSRGQLAREHRELARERRSERRWKLLFQGLLFGGPLVLTLVYLLFFAGAMGLRWGPLGPVVGVVSIAGDIEPASLASAERVVPALTRAFEAGSVKAVVLAIDSRGGAAVEAERIADAVRYLKRKHRKPVYAVIGNLGASGGYMIALAADRIYAGRWSLVGSVGTMISAWDLHKIPPRFEARQHVWSSGRLKGFLNPFAEPNEEAYRKAQALVEAGGSEFVRELERSRGTLLKPGVDYASGEIWSGQQAKDLGLVDEIGTLDEVIDKTFGLKAYHFGPKQQGFGLFSAGSGDLARSIAGALVPSTVPHMR